MALKMDISTKFGIAVKNSYIRINSLYGSKEIIGISLNYYVSQETFTRGDAPIKESGYEFSPNVEDGADNFIKQGYEYLKSLPAFIDAIDVLEE